MRCPAVCLSHAGIVLKQRKLGSISKSSSKNSIFGDMRFFINWKGVKQSESITWGRENFFQSSSRHYLENGAWLTGRRIRSFDWRQSQRTWMTWNGQLRTPLHKTCVFRNTPQKLKKTDPYYLWRKCRQRTLVSGNIRFMRNMRIFAEVSWRGGVKWQWPVRNGNFQFFRSLSSEALEVRPTFLYR